MKYKQTQHTTNFKRFRTTTAKVIATATVVAAPLFLAGNSYAATCSNDAFCLSPASASYYTGQTITMTIDESSTDAVNAVTVNLTYDASLLKYDSYSVSGSPFSTVVSAGGGSGTADISSSVPDTTVTGTQLVGTITFTAEATGTAAVAVATGPGGAPTMIVDEASDTNVWSAAGDTAASYTLTTPPPPPTNTGTGSTGTTTTKTSGTSTKKTTTTTKTTSTPAKTTTTTTTPAPTTTTTTTPTTTVTPPPSVTDNIPSTATLSLTILDSNGKPVNNAKVSIDNGAVTRYTNSSGIVVFNNVKSGSTSVEVTDNGKKTIKTEYTLTGGQNKLASLKLTNASDSLAFTVGAVIVILALASGVYLYFRRKHPKFHSTGSHIDSSSIVTGGGASLPTAPTPTPLSTAATTLHSTLQPSAVVRPGQEDSSTTTNTTVVSPTPTPEPAPAPSPFVTNTQAVSTQPTANSTAPASSPATVIAPTPQPMSTPPTSTIIAPTASASTITTPTTNRTMF